MTALPTRVSLVPILFLLAGPAALAQAAPVTADDGVRVEETVIVTLPGPAREAGELIGNATALTREALIVRLPGTLGDALDAQPGVSSTYFGQGASRPVLRGLGAERVQVLTNGTGVIDASAASPDHQVTADGLDSERIEIIRGPAALAYGGQAIGGVVNVIDGLIAEVIPQQPLSGEAFGAYNSVNEGSEGALRFGGVGGSLVVNLSASGRDFGDFDIPGRAEAFEEEHEDGEGHDGETEGTVPNSFLKAGTLSGGVSLVAETGFIGVSVRQTSSEYGLPGHGHEDLEHGEDEGGEDAEEEDPFIDLEQTRYDLRAGLKLHGELLTGIRAAVTTADYTHTEFEAPGEAGTVFRTDGTEARLELDHQVSGWNGTAGLQLVDSTLDAVGDEAFITATNTSQIGAFLYEAREWESGFGAEAGLRLERVTRENEGQGKARFNLLSGSFGVHRHLESGWFLGAQVSRTQRAPTDVELFANGPHLATQQFEIGDSGLKRETGTNLELVTRWTQGPFAFSANVFAADFKDFIVLFPGTTVVDGLVVDEADDLPVFNFVQDDAQFVGGEVMVSARFDDGVLGAQWELGAQVDWVSGELDVLGDVPLLPPVTLGLNAQADWGDVRLGGDVTLAGDQDNPGTGRTATDGYTRLDLRGDWKLPWGAAGGGESTLFVLAHNVTDEEVRNSTSVLKDIVPQPGRNVRLGLRLTF